MQRGHADCKPSLVGKCEVSSNMEPNVSQLHLLHCCEYVKPLPGSTRVCTAWVNSCAKLSAVCLTRGPLLLGLLVLDANALQRGGIPPLHPRATDVKCQAGLTPVVLLHCPFLKSAPSCRREWQRAGTQHCDRVSSYGKFEPKTPTVILQSISRGNSCFGFVNGSSQTIACGLLRYSCCIASAPTLLQSDFTGS